MSNRSKVAVINSISAADREDPVHRSNRSLDDRPIHRAGRVACSAPCIQSGAHMNVCVCGGGGGGGGGSERQKVCARVCERVCACACVHLRCMKHNARCMHASTMHDPRSTIHKKKPSSALLCLPPGSFGEEVLRIVCCPQMPRVERCLEAVGKVVAHPSSTFAVAQLVWELAISLL